MNIKSALVILISLIWGFVNNASAQQETLVIADFIKNNPEKSAMYLVQNGKVLADIHSDRKSPLASTVKIIVAIEYATQAAAGKISPAAMIDTVELGKYYMPNTDGGAHPLWLATMQKQGLVNEGKVSLEEVAKGMINFSSNANTEYLLDLLGLENINAQLDKLGLKEHEKLYYFVSALAVINGKALSELEKMSLSEYIIETNKAHEQFKNDKNYKSTIKNIPLDAQKVWSDRLVRSTPKEYVSIMQKINGRKFFGEKVQRNIDIVMEGILANPVNRQWLAHAGMKGGSTLWVLTKSCYATTTTGETTEFAYFFNNLTIAESIQLRKNMDSFELAILNNRDGKRDEILEILKGK